MTETRAGRAARCLAALLLAASAAAEDPLDFWPAWRGPLATGAAPRATPPVEWSESRNRRWVRELPGRGHSSPVVWGDLVVVTAAVPVGAPIVVDHAPSPGAHHVAPVARRYESRVVALRRRDGAIAWQTTVHVGIPHQGVHETASHASASPVTDGERIIASFGSRGLYALDMEGRVLWATDLGDMQVKHDHGEGSSPALHDGVVVVSWDHEGQSALVALDAVTGAERWRVPRREGTSWSTPIVVELEGGAQVIAAGNGAVRGHDLATGERIWQGRGLSENVVASPVAGEGLVFAGSSYTTRALLAVRIDAARGDVTGTPAVAWSRRRGAPYVPSPLLYGESLYVLHHYQGVLSRLDAATGAEDGGPFRLPGIRDVYASPVAADGRVYITARDGATLVLPHRGAPEVLALNRIDDRVSASAALAGSELYLRGERALYCFATPSEPGSPGPARR